MPKRVFSLSPLIIPGFKPGSLTIIAVICLGFLLITGCSSNDGSKKQILAASDETPELVLLNEGTEAYERGAYTLAQERWRSLIDNYPDSDYITLAGIKLADSYFFSRNYAEALVAYENFIRLHTAHEAAAYARYQMGQCHYQKYHGIKRDQSPLRLAIKEFETLLREHPDSEYAPQARRLLSDSREFQSAHTAFVALFYVKRDLLRAAANRFAELRLDYADTEARKNAELMLELEYPQVKNELEGLIEEEKQQVALANKEEKLRSPTILNALLP